MTAQQKEDLKIAVELMLEAGGMECTCGQDESNCKFCYLSERAYTKGLEAGVILTWLD